MLIDEYFVSFQNTIEQSPIVQTFTITYDKRTAYRGFIRGKIVFVDNSVLHIREFVNVRNTNERLIYAYHYMNAGQELMFRYDNAEHHQKLNLSTYPHHKHVQHDDRIIESHSPDLAAVLYEIQLLLVF